MRRVVPPLDAIDSLRRPLQRGEQAVLRLLTEHLPEQWEIYVHPHLNGLEPDFVLLHPERGIAVIEVKDWDLSKYFVQDGSVWVRRNGGDVRVGNPLAKAEMSLPHFPGVLA
ncbi:MAG: nuclease-related domain-containing protein [Chloroflexota bacterium]